MKKIALVAMMILSGVPANAETPNPEKLLCEDGTKIEAELHEKGYFHLLDMKNQNGTNEQLWSGGRDMVITIERDKKICLVSTASEVTFNPYTLEKIIEVYRKSQKGL